MYYLVNATDEKLVYPWSIAFYDEYVAVICPSCEGLNCVHKNTETDGFKCHKCKKIIIYPGAWTENKDSYKITDGKTRDAIFNI